MSFKEIVERDLLKIQSDLSYPTFTFAGTSYPCHTGAGSKEWVLDKGGFDVQADLVLIVRCIDLVDVTIRSQNKIVYDGNTYRVAKVIKSPTQAFYKFVCVSDTRGI